MRIYAGVGARYNVPAEILARATKIATELRDAGWILRSGGAVGMDAAWYAGAGDRSEIFRAADCTPEAYYYAAMFHPKWRHLSHRARLLHGRNCMIVLGADLKTPVERVLCWTPNGEEVGGTGMALRLADAHAIPVTNLGSPPKSQNSLPFNLTP